MPRSLYYGKDGDSNEMIGLQFPALWDGREQAVG